MIIFFQFVAPTSRGISSNIRQQPVQVIKMIQQNESPSNLLQVIRNPRLQPVTVQKPQQNVTQQLTTAEASVSPNNQQQASPNQQQSTTTQPQHSPQQVRVSH